MTKHTSLDHMVGGTHYQLHRIQPIAIAMGNDFSAARAFALKHCVRPSKGQVRQDIEKALHYLDMLEETWPRVTVRDFIDGLTDVSANMRSAASNICLAQGTDAAMHRAIARGALRRELAVLGDA